MSKEKSSIKKSREKITWCHPGGKFRRLGPQSCSENELLAIILGSGVKDKTAQQIADDILGCYHSLYGLMGITLRELMQIKGLKDVKATQLAAVFEIARRILKYLEKE
ncbi:MAG: DNA repair protein RadC [Candidatus Scalindua rubra]|uniref:DNA repair protein RadC n=1 Tax=Candidatus Scalindua rubra TaxID=1872076 RepID=A0A1E3XAF4_9BACT|nr:MAG: DNA repair protein RadC [Candidatus Scalindua rubra]